MHRKAIFFASIFSLLIGIFANLNYYYFITDQIEEARLLFEVGGGDTRNFHSVFWVCNKIFSFIH